MDLDGRGHNQLPGKRLEGWSVRKRWTCSVVGLICLLSALVVPGTAQAATTQPFTKVWYGDAKLQTIDIYKATKPNAPLVVLVHGGAWESDDQVWNKGQALDLQKAGDAVFVVNYESDSPTQAAFPMEVDNVVEGTEWAIRYGKPYNANTSSVTYVAGSAGSTLVALATEKLNTSSHRVVKAVVTLSGAMDFSIIKPLDPEQAQAIGCDPTNCSPALEAAASPAEHITAADCPSDWLILNGTKEKTPLSQADALHAALEKVGCASTLLEHPGVDHAWQYWNDELPSVLKFLAKVQGSK
jgi:arylformamidase